MLGAAAGGVVGAAAGGADGAADADGAGPEAVPVTAGAAPQELVARAEAEPSAPPGATWPEG